MKLLTCTHLGERYKIEEDLPDIGWYLYKLNKSGKCSHDYLQDSLELAISCAEEVFGVPKEKWPLNEHTDQAR